MMKKIIAILSLLTLVSLPVLSAEIGTRSNDARSYTPETQYCPGGIKEIDLAISDYAGGSMIPVTNAIQTGLFVKNCVKINLIETKGDQSKLLMEGKIDAISEPIELLHVDLMGKGYADIIAVRIITDKPTIALVTKSGSDNLIGVNAEYQDRLQSLNGKTVAVNVCDPIGSMKQLSPNATGTQQLRYMLEKVGLRGVCGTKEEYLARIPGASTENTVFLVTKGLDNKNLVAAVMNKETDLAIVPSPYHVTHGLRVVVNHIDFPNVPGSALMVMREWYQQAQNRDTIGRVNLALQESTKMLLDNPILAKIIIQKDAAKRNGIQLSDEQANTIYEDQMFLWSSNGIANPEAVANIQWIFMSDLGLKVGLCGCPGTEDSYAFGAIGGKDPEGERDGYVLYVTPAHAGHFEGLTAHETPEWNAAFQRTLTKFGITDPSTLDKEHRRLFYSALEEALKE